MKKVRRINLILGIIITGIMLSFVVIGIFNTPFDPTKMNGRLKCVEPSITHLFGTDNFGRDVLSRVMVGSKNTIIVALVTVAIGSIVGIIVGIISGYKGGIVDSVLMRLNDSLTAFPSILVALLFISVSGANMKNLMLALGIVFIPSFTRIVRSEVIKNKNQEYVKAAEAQGVGTLRIIFRHILPNSMDTILSAVAIGFTNAVLAESSMSYLGLGITPPTPSLGKMLSEAQTYLFKAPWMAIAPGVFIVLVALGASLMSEGIRDITN